MHNTASPFSPAPAASCSRTLSSWPAVGFASTTVRAHSWRNWPAVPAQNAQTGTGPSPRHRPLRAPDGASLLAYPSQETVMTHRPYEALTAENAALVLVDHQIG